MIKEKKGNTIIYKCGKAYDKKVVKENKENKKESAFTDSKSTKEVDDDKE